jgi:outer membrane protein TolC
LTFEQGVGTSLDLISAAQALRQAELNAVLLDARVVQARARAALTSASCHF